MRKQSFNAENCHWSEWKLNEIGSMSDNDALRRSWRSCLATKRRYYAETERHKDKKGRGRRQGLLLIWSLITEGPRAPGALGPLFLEDASLVLSSSPSSFSSTPSRTLQRTPNYLCLHIYLLSPFRSFFPSLFFFGHPSPACIMHLKIAW